MSSVARWRAQALVLVIAGMLAVSPWGYAEDASRPSGRLSKDRNPRQPSPRSTIAPGSDDATSAISRLGVPPARTVLFTEEREAAARAFVTKNRPEMLPVLDQLKLSKPQDYQQVICDLFRTSEFFTAMKQDDRARQEIALKVWQTEAKTHLLAAELASHPERAEVLTAELRITVEALADLQIEQAAYAVKQLEAKARRAEGQRKKLESGRNEFVNQRTEAILQAVRGLKSDVKVDSKLTTSSSQQD